MVFSPFPCVLCEVMHLTPFQTHLQRPKGNQLILCLAAFKAHVRPQILSSVKCPLCSESKVELSTVV